MRAVGDNTKRKFAQFAKTCPNCGDRAVRATYYCAACLPVAKRNGHKKYAVKQEHKRLRIIRQSLIASQPCKHCGLRLRLCSDGMCSSTCRELYHRNIVPTPRQRGFLLSDVHKL